MKDGCLAIVGLCVIGVSLVLVLSMCDESDNTSNDGAGYAYLLCSAFESTASELSVGSVSDCTVSKSARAINVTVPMSQSEAIKLCRSFSAVLDENVPPNVRETMRTEKWSVRVMTSDSYPNPVATCRI